jgi:phospholipid/cholesterol/gamma-HCH transport system substrate-binding protein
MKKEWMAREKTVEIVVGAFVLLVFLGLAYFTIMLSREAWFSERHEMNVVFSDVMGLRDGDSVVVRGMPVGKVLGLSLTNGGVCVRLSLEQKIEPRADYSMSIVTTSILGGRHLEIEEGVSSDVLPRDMVFRGRDPQNLMEDAAEAVSAIKHGLIDGGVMANLTNAVAQLAEITARVNRGEGALGKLLSKDDTLYSDIAASAASVKAITARLEKGEGTLGKLLSGEDQLYKDVSATAASLKEIAGRLERGEGALGKLLSKDDSVYRDLAATIESLRAVSDRLEKGEGTIGKLLKDESAYDELTKTIREARAALDDFRENTPVVTFTSILFGAL